LIQHQMLTMKMNEVKSVEFTSCREESVVVHPYFRQSTCDTASTGCASDEDSEECEEHLEYYPLSFNQNLSFLIKSSQRFLPNDEVLPCPSPDWWQAYMEWHRSAFPRSKCPSPPGSSGSSYDSVETNCCSGTCRAGHPTFETSDSLHDFNERGLELVFLLRQELAQQQSRLSPHVTFVVEPYERLLSNIRLGRNAASWWHIKDMSYGYVIPSLQRLPISDELKCQLSQWRRRTSRDWIDSSHRASFRHDGRDLQQLLSYELNVRPHQQINCFLYQANRRTYQRAVLRCKTNNLRAQVQVAARAAEA
jgi:hypothetical protein